jgi:hypothetical protein
VIDTTVIVRCDFVPDNEDFCEAEFEVSRLDLPDALRSLVQGQLERRGWTGTIPGQVTCPLHRAADQPTEVADR